MAGAQDPGASNQPYVPFYASTDTDQSAIVDPPKVDTPLTSQLPTPGGPTEVMTQYWQRWFQRVYAAITHLHYTDHAYNETPGGKVDGTNNVFTLASPPNLPQSLQLFVNGLLANFGVDYTLNTTVMPATVTFVKAPAAGAVMLAFYQK
jgi:hypothetical protein